MLAGKAAGRRRGPRQSLTLSGDSHEAQEELIACVENVDKGFQQG